MVQLLEAGGHDVLISREGRGEHLELVSYNPEATDFLDDLVALLVPVQSLQRCAELLVNHYRIVLCVIPDPLGLEDAHLHGDGHCFLRVAASDYPDTLACHQGSGWVLNYDHADDYEPLSISSLQDPDGAVSELLELSIEGDIGDEQCLAIGVKEKVQFLRRKNVDPVLVVDDCAHGLGGHGEGDLLEDVVLVLLPICWVRMTPLLSLMMGFAEELSHSDREHLRDGERQETLAMLLPVRS